MKRELDVKLWKTGNSYVVTIPARLIKKWGLQEGQDITLILKKE